jgi:sugar/nucleoside kinase (ribokinase family)
MSKPLLVVGSVAFDSIKTRAGERTDILGGAATYISIAASHFAPVNLVAVVGKDDFPAEHTAMLAEKNINLDGLELAEGRTFRWQGIYADDFSTRETLGTELGVFETFDPEIPDSYQNPDILLLGNISPAVQLKVMERISGNPFIITDTMNLWMNIALGELKRVIKNTNLLVINDEEAVQLSGEQQIKVAAQKILKMGPETLIIKRGEHGAYLFSGDKIFFSAAIPLDEVIDPTGAGDSFAGGLAGYLASRGKTDFKTVKKGMLYGTAVASATCEGFGTEKTASVTGEQIEHRFNELQRLVSIN